MTNFNSKETYLAARAEWKANYNELSTKIRKARADYNEAQRIFSKTPTGSAYYPACRAVNAARYDRGYLSQQANAMINELAEMKEEARRQWQEQVQPA